MKSWLLTLLLGFVAWLIPFVVAVLVFPFREPYRPLFESIMADIGLTYVNIPVITIGLGIARSFKGASIRQRANKTSGANR